MGKRLKRKLLEVHNIFLKSVKKDIVGEFLIGTIAYAREKILTHKSDLDIICIVENEKLSSFLNSKYLMGIIKPTIAKEVLKKKISDYLVLKVYIKNVLLSIDIISPSFFEKMCTIDLCKQKKYCMSYKYGNEPQLNEYPVSEFNGVIHFIKKKSKKYKGGYSIELPLFFISSKGNYRRGIPTIKCITHKVYYDPTGIILWSISALYKNIVKRLIQEYPNLNREEYHDYFLNLLKNKHKFTKRYKGKILKEVNFLLDKEK